MSFLKDRTWGFAVVVFLVACFALLFDMFGDIRVTVQKAQDARLTYDQVDSGLDGISRLVELLSSDSFKQSSAEVQEAASMTIEAFVLQFGPSLDEAKRTGDTNHLGLLRALMSGDKDAEILYRRELGLIKVKPYSGD